MILRVYFVVSTSMNFLFVKVLDI